MSMGGSWQSLRSMQKADDVADTKIRKGTTRRVLSYAKGLRALITVFLTVTVVDALLQVAAPLLLKRIVDDGVVPGARGVVIGLALLVAGVAVLDAAVGVLARWLSSRLGEGLIYDLRRQVFGHVLRQPIAFFTRAQTGALVTRLNTDVIGAQQAFTSVLSTIVSNVLGVTVVVATMLVLSWQLTLLALLIVPLFLLPARLIGRRLAGLSRVQMSENAELGARMTERFNVAGALLVKLYGRPAQEDGEYAARAAKVRDAGVKIAWYRGVFMNSMLLMASLATAVVYGVGGLLAIDGGLTIGTLLAMAALLGRLYTPLTALANMRVDVLTALVSFERVFEVLDLPPLVREPEHPKQLPDGPLSIELDDVTFGYPSADEVSLASLEGVARVDRDHGGTVLHDVKMKVEAGQMVALVGPSGAGKSTLTALLTRLYDPTEGSVRVGGVDLREVAGDDLRGRVGSVVQEAHLFHDTIGENLRYARPDATDAELEEVLRAAQVWSVVERLPQGLDTVVGDRGHRMSGGEKQRLAIARLLLKSPSVVVLDEATAHLDSESEAAVQTALDTALAGRTSVVIAHRLSTVRDADQIFVVEDGRIVERGDHDGLLAAGGRYADLYRTQFRQHRSELGTEPAAAR